MRRKIKVKRRQKPKLSNKKNFTKETKDFMNNMKVYRIQTMRTRRINIRPTSTTLCNKSIIM